MAYSTKTSIGDRNVVVQNGGSESVTVWLEVERADELATEMVALTAMEALTLGRQLTAHGIEASRREISQGQHEDALIAVH